MPIQRDPTSTGSSGGWTPTGAATLHEAVADASDSSFISCADGSACDLALQTAENPLEFDGAQVVVRMQKAVDTSQTCDQRVELLESGSVIATWDELDIESSWTDHALNVPPFTFSEATNFSALSVRVTDLASPATATNNVSRAYLTLPDRRTHGYSCCG